MAVSGGCPHCGAQGLQVSAATKVAQVSGTLCFPISALSAKGQHISQKAHVLCYRRLSSCFRVLRFVSCLQMQRKVKVMITLTYFFFCFGLNALLSLLPHSTALASFHSTLPHAPPWHSPIWLQPQPSLVFPEIYWRGLPTRLCPQAGCGWV